MALTFPEDLAVLGEHWAEAVRMTPDKATRYAQAAETQIAALPPTITDLTVANASYVIAVALQASEIAKASVRDGGVITGPDGQHVRPRPVLDAVRALVRPRRVSWTVG